jgi:hypothetical protein
MDRSTPEACFLSAQQAMLAGDWEGFFACVDTASLQRLAVMVIALVTDPQHETFVASCRDLGVSSEALADVRRSVDAVSASAAASSWDPSAPTPEMFEQSNRHHELVKADAATRLAAVKQVPDLAAFMAASERYRRAVSGGGSVSSTLFVDETLTDVAIDGSKATGVRTMVRGHTERVRFVRRRGQWHVSIG